MARNGYLAEDGIVLVTVEDNDQLIATAARSFFAMRAAAALDGVAITIVEPAGAYRPAWVQADMVDHPERWNLNPASSIGFSRYGQSHGWGNRIDVNSAAVPWMLAHGRDFGWIREYGERDPNHFKHDGVTATGGGASGGGIPTPTTRRDSDMDLNFLKADVPGQPQGYLLTGPGVCELFPQTPEGKPSPSAAAWGEILHIDVTSLKNVGQDVYTVAQASAKSFRDAIRAGISTGGSATDLAPVLAALAALDKQSDDYQAQLLKAIAGVDEATLATFGLKRA